MNLPLSIALALLAAFLLGGIPSGLWIGRAVQGIDVRQHGSGNLGATNVYRTLGPRWGLLVLLIDAAKGAAGVLIARLLVPSEPVLAGVLGMAGAFVGHMFTPFAGFKGGKGVATAGGAWAALVPVAVLSALTVWILVFVTTRIVSLASIAAAIVLPIGVVVSGSGSPREPWIWFSLATAAFVVVRHRGNLSRLRKGEESTLSIRGPAPSPKPDRSVDGRGASLASGSARGESRMGSHPKSRRGKGDRP